ncbi:MAG: putative nucleotide-diphospho-sugar transferase [Ignavibacteria bacterium]|jgi:hypothetical protein
MKIVAIYFERKKKFRSFKRVFFKSCKKIMPKTKCQVIEIPLPENIDHKRDTAYAFLAACKYALRSKVFLAICDIDLMFQKSILDIEKVKFDIAITTRQSNMRYNTGLWFYRPTKKAKIFVKRWYNNTRKILHNFCEYEEFSHQYGGIDQAALHTTINENKKIGAKIVELSCLEWNATQSEWKHITENNRVIHVKSGLSGACFGKPIPEGHEYMKKIIDIWKGYAK